MKTRAASSGFTLIEMSIVLVIIGFIVGGVLMGKNLISAARVRAQITQIEKFNTATNTFRGKYGGLPGDLNSTSATQFGFVSRGPSPGEGDGNGTLEGWNGASNADYILGCGETAVFWVDLSTATLIDAGLNTPTETSQCSGANITGVSIAGYMPVAKIGGGNYISAWSSHGQNYFGIGATGQITMGNGGAAIQNLGLTVAQSYAIDTKVDDGYPLTGNVTTYVIGPSGTIGWAPSFAGTPSNSQAISGGTTTCFDNNGNGGSAQHYSVEISGGSNLTCALSFRFQ